MTSLEFFALRSDYPIVVDETAIVNLTTYIRIVLEILGQYLAVVDH